jgi:hypothetical protein
MSRFVTELLHVPAARTAHDARPARRSAARDVRAR